MITVLKYKGHHLLDKTDMKLLLIQQNIQKSVISKRNGMF